MKTLIQLLDLHKITKPADRLEFEEVVNDVVRASAAEKQTVSLAAEKAISEAKDEAQSQVTAERAANDVLKAELETLKAKTQWALTEAAAAIADTSKDDKATVAHIASVIEEVSKDDKQRRIDELKVSIAANQAALDALA